MTRTEIIESLETYKKEHLLSFGELAKEIDVTSPTLKAFYRGKNQLKTTMDKIKEFAESKNGGVNEENLQKLREEDAQKETLKKIVEVRDRRVQLVLTSSLFDAISSAAYENHRSLNDFVTEVLSNYLNYVNIKSDALCKFVEEFELFVSRVDVEVERRK